MLEPKRIESTINPQKFIDLGNGNWYYNYDIKSEVVEVPRMDNHEELIAETRWNFIQVKFRGKPEYKKCVELIIREYITQSQEFDLINSAKKVEFGMLTEEEAKKEIDKYKNYLNITNIIKNKVKEDFQQ